MSITTLDRKMPISSAIYWCLISRNLYRVFHHFEKNDFEV